MLLFSSEWEDKCHVHKPCKIHLMAAELVWTSDTCWKALKCCFTSAPVNYSKSIWRTLNGITSLCLQHTPLALQPAQETWFFSRSLSYFTVRLMPTFVMNSTLNTSSQVKESFFFAQEFRQKAFQPSCSALVRVIPSVTSKGNITPGCFLTLPFTRFNSAVQLTI